MKSEYEFGSKHKKSTRIGSEAERGRYIRSKQLQYQKRCGSAEGLIAPPGQSEVDPCSRIALSRVSDFEVAPRIDRSNNGFATLAKAPGSPQLRRVILVPL